MISHHRSLKSAVGFRISSTAGLLILPKYSGVRNLICYCNNCDANRVLLTFRERTAAAPSRPSGLLNAKFTFKGTSLANHFRTDS